MYRRFEWDENKNQSNIRKHRISFELATRAFSDEFAYSYPERVENGEQRWQTLGKVEGCLLVLVAHTLWDENEMEVVRIISARPATPSERKRYDRENSYI